MDEPNARSEPNRNGSLAAAMAARLIARHPGRAAAVLEALDPAPAATALAGCEARAAAGVLARMVPAAAAAVLATLRPERASALVDALDLDVAARLVRRLGSEAAEGLLASLSAGRARSLRTLLGFAEKTAGALMDPDVLALAEDLTAREAVERVREAARHARYNLYVVDREQRLVGVLNLRELLLAPPSARLAELMVRGPQHLRADADRVAVLSHPGWREVHALPVVDQAGGYLGAIRYRTLRALEEELLGPRGADRDTAGALGELFAAGAAGVLDAFAGGPRGEGR